MVDIEKVKNGLQCCAVGAECDHCKYSLMNNSDNGRFAGCYQLHNDALVLVEEQQAESVDAFIQWCADSHMIGDATLNGIKYWVEKYKEFVSKGR